MGSFLVAMGAKRITAWIVLLGLIGGLIWVGVEFNERGNALRQAQSDIKVAKKSILVSENTINSLRRAQADSSKKWSKYRKEVRKDSVLMQGQIAELQVVVKEVNKDKLYWKEYSRKLESDSFVVTRKWFLGKKVLVPNSGWSNSKHYSKP